MSRVLYKKSILMDINLYRIGQEKINYKIIFKKEVQHIPFLT